MSSDDELSRMFSAERAEHPSTASAERGLHQLRAALGAKAGASALAYGPLKLGLAVAVKWSAGSGLLVLALLSAGAGLSATAPPLAPKAAPNAASGRAVTSVALEVPLPATSVDSPSAVPQSPNLAAPVRVSSQPPEAGSSFTEELRLIKSAKQALDAGRDQQATALLYEHARLYPNGVFQSERDALSVLLDCKRAPVAGSAAAQRFVEQNSHSPLVDRISRACGLTTGPAKANFPEMSNAK